VRSSIRRGTATLSLCFVLAMSMLAGTASAHVVYQSGNTGWFGNKCVWQKSEVSHGSSGKGYFLAGTHAKEDVAGFSCAGNSFMAAGNIKTQLQFYTTDQFGGSTALCYSSGLLASTILSYELTIAYDANIPPCGSLRYYRTRGLGQVWSGTAWVGSYLWSGTPGVHFLPA